MGNIKEIKIKYRTYYISDDMSNMKNFDSRLLKIDKITYQKYWIYHNERF